MALLQNSPRRERLEIPLAFPGAEPGDWIEVDFTYNVGMRRRLTIDTQLAADGAELPEAVGFNDFKAALAIEIIKAWSEPAPLTPENIGKLHPSVFDWLFNEFNIRNTPRLDEDEKKSSDESSRPSPEDIHQTSPSN